MKFGRNLPRNQVPEWASSYIKYKKLKKLIKSAVEDVKNGKGVDTAGETLYMLYARMGNNFCQNFSISSTGTWKMWIISTTESTRTQSGASSFYKIDTGGQRTCPMALIAMS